MPVDLSLVVDALSFAAEKHRRQRRKDAQQSPYINHPIEVVRLLWTQGGIDDPVTLSAALLHDTLEDTDATADEILKRFGQEVLSVILEVTDDKALPKAERKQNQILTAAHLSQRARQIKLADKINNVRDVAHLPPHSWPIERRTAYLDWACAVVNQLRGGNDRLEKYFDETLAAARAKILADSSNAT